MQENMSMHKKRADGTMAPKKFRVLVCAPSNTAVDELAYRLHTQGVLGYDGRRAVGLNIVRIGAGGRKEKGSSCEDGGFGSFIGGSSGSQDWTEMNRVVERLHLGKDEGPKLIVQYLMSRSLILTFSLRYRLSRG